MKFFSKEVKIGITAIIAMLIVYFGIIFLKGVKLSHTDNVYYVRMNNVNGLLVAGDVVCSGLKVGTVKNMNYDEIKQEIIVAAELEEGFHLTKGSNATIHKDMLGAPKLNINLGPNSKKLLTPGDTIDGDGGAADLLTAAGEMLPTIQNVLPKIDSLISALNDIVRSTQVNNSLNNIENITNDLQTSTTKLNSLMADLNGNVPQLVNKANNIATSLESTTKDLSEADIKGIAKSAQQTMEKANNAMESIQNITSQLDKKMGSEDNSLGKLLNDKELYERLDTTLENASILLQDIKQHPTRYVNISVFGKKAK